MRIQRVEMIECSCDLGLTRNLNVLLLLRNED